MHDLLRTRTARWTLLAAWLSASFGGLLYVEYEAALRGILCRVATG
ncbi:hypothetical protein [Uliginosibacterium sp. 31-12]|nr:hypothetical protein [Uliginosibacterium sp. 31-12]MDO6385752.1 hypothetical protein [Uliginosibacterium sp. 31-12]